MSTLIKTNIKDNNNITVTESVVQIGEFLDAKSSFIYVTKVDHNSTEKGMLIKKSTILFVK